MCTFMEGIYLDFLPKRSEIPSMHVYVYLENRILEVTSPKDVATLTFQAEGSGEWFLCFLKPCSELFAELKMAIYTQKDPLKIQ